MKTNVIILAECKKAMTVPQHRIEKISSVAGRPFGVIPASSPFVNVIVMTPKPANLYPNGITLNGYILPTTTKLELEFSCTVNLNAPLRVWISGDESFNYKRSYLFPMLFGATTFTIPYWELQTSFTIENLMKISSKQYWKVSAESGTMLGQWSDVASFNYNLAWIGVEKTE